MIWEIWLRKAVSKLEIKDGWAPELLRGELLEGTHYVVSFQDLPRFLGWRRSPQNLSEGGLCALRLIASLINSGKQFVSSGRE